MKKILISLFFTSLLMLIFASNSVYAATGTKTATPPAKVMYFSPDSNIWAPTPPASDALKIYKKGSKYYLNDKPAFELQSDITMIIKDTFVAINNTDLKFYTVKYKDSAFSVVQMNAKEVQPLFDDVKVIGVSEFQDGVTTIKRPPFMVEKYMLVNDTDANFDGYRFSPTSVQRFDIKGQFIATKVGVIKFLKDGDVYQKSPILTIKVRNDAEKYSNPQTIRINHN